MHRNSKSKSKAETMRRKQDRVRKYGTARPTRVVVRMDEVA